MGLYEEFYHSEQVDKALDANKKLKKEMYTDMAVEAEAAKRFEHNKMRFERLKPNSALNREVKRFVEEALVTDYFKEKASQLRNARAEAPEITPEMERRLGSEVFQHIVDERRVKEVSEELKNNPPSFSQEAWFQRKADNRHMEMCAKYFAEKKLSRMKPEEKKEALAGALEMADMSPGFEFNPQKWIERFIYKQDVEAYLADPKMRDQMVEMRLDTYKAQDRINALKKEGKPAPHIEEAYQQVRRERKAEQEKTTNVVSAVLASKRTR